MPQPGSRRAGLEAHRPHINRRQRRSQVALTFRIEDREDVAPTQETDMPARGKQQPSLRVVAFQLDAALCILRPTWRKGAAAGNSSQVGPRGTSPSLPQPLYTSLHISHHHSILDATVCPPEPGSTKLDCQTSAARQAVLHRVGEPVGESSIASAGNYKVVPSYKAKAVPRAAGLSTRADCQKCQRCTVSLACERPF